MLSNLLREKERVASNFPKILDPSQSALFCSRAVREFFYTLWLFTRDDFDTFVLPNTLFGVSTAYSSCALPYRGLEQIYFMLQRLPFVLFFNWSNLLIFDLANQRLPDSIREDAINKPWRPLPTRRISQQQTRHLMLLAMLVTLIVSFGLGVWKETTLLFNLTWVYNDLRGGDDHWLLRNLVIAAAFFLYNLGSLRLANPDYGCLTSEAYRWTGVISAVIFTTMHVQDLKDQEGDRTRGRKTAPLVLGNTMARWTIAIPVLFWSFGCAKFWGPWNIYASLPVVLGLYAAYRAVGKRGRKDDRRTWKLWCAWTVTLYMLPVAAKFAEW